MRSIASAIGDTGQGTESSLQPAGTSTVVVRTPASEGSTNNDSSDEQSEDKDYALT